MSLFKKKKTQKMKPEDALTQRAVPDNALVIGSTVSGKARSFINPIAFKNIEKLIEFGYEIVIEKVRYGTGFYIAFDSADLTYKPFTELLEGIRGFDDIAMTYGHALEEIESKYPDYPVARAESLVHGLFKIDEKAERWFKNYTIFERDNVSEEIESMVRELAKHWN